MSWLADLVIAYEIAKLALISLVIGGAAWWLVGAVARWRRPR